MDELESISGRWWDEVWATGNVEVLDELISDPFTRHTASGTIVGTRDEYKDVLRSVQRTLYRPNTTIDDRQFGDDRIWTRATSRGVNLDTGEMTVVCWILIQRVADGRIVEQWVLGTRDVEWQT